MIVNSQARLVAIVALVLFAACGGGASPASTLTPTTLPSASQAASVLPSPSGTPSPAPTVRLPSPTALPGLSDPADPCKASSLTVTALWVVVDVPATADRSCLLGHDLHVTGWLAPSWGIGGISSGIVPAWLGEWDQEPVLWLKPHPADGCNLDDDCVWIFVHVQPGSGLTLGPPERWVELTGHLDDPAAATCRWTGVGEPIATEAVVPTCRARFVATSVSDVAVQ